MKELTIEQKAEAYDKALERARIWKEMSGMPKDKQGILDNIFPELNESEDERIRREIITYLSTAEDKELIPYESWLTWLEKQGQTFTKEEVGNANKVEPKFKAGDWVIDKLGVVCQIANVIENVTNHTYGYDIVGGGYFNDNTEEVRLWNINDAKDGDVLCSEQIILLFKKWEYNSDWNCVIAYAGIDITGKLQITNEHWLISNHTHPATKEQRNTLIKAMADAGYTFDFEKKELKKISQRMISAEAKEAMYGKPAWSEEDDAIRNDLINYFRGSALETPEKEVINFLKSLKDRVQSQPKQEENKGNLGGISSNWSEEDERIVRTIISDGSRGVEFDILQINWLKSLKQRIGG